MQAYRISDPCGSGLIYMLACPPESLLHGNESPISRGKGAPADGDWGNVIFKYCPADNCLIFELEAVCAILQVLFSAVLLCLPAHK